MNPSPKPHLKLKRQVVAGFVIYRRGSYWNFPKGHFNEDEKTMDVALRETYEETGLRKSDLRIIPDFRAYEKFYFREGNELIHDTVVLFLAETKNPRIIISTREHSGYAWFTYRDAVKVLGSKYVATRKVLKQANDLIHRKSLSHHKKNSAR
jgi:8-oxo-dGTP pyrophosphatase MutT (NUDIX family)